MPAFGEVLTAATPIEGGIAVDVPETWHQGRTAYGGFSSALCLAAAQQVGGEGLAPLRSAQMAMMAPVAGHVRATARIERQGRNATWISARIDGDKGLAFTASFVFMGRVESALHLNDRPVPEGLVPAEAGRPETLTRDMPVFLAENFETRHAFAAEPGKRPEICRWVRLSDSAGLDPMVELLLLGDALPPGVLPMLPAIVPLSSMHWQVALLDPAPRTSEGWWLLRSVGDYAEHGCSSQRMAIWNAGGAAVMAGMQSIALFG